MAVPATFAMDLCKYRATNGMPNTSDASDKASVKLGEALFERLHVPVNARGDEPTGLPFAAKVAADLAVRVSQTSGFVVVTPEMHLKSFQQYQHVGAISAISAEPSTAYVSAWRRLTTEIGKRVTSPPAAARKVQGLIAAVEEAVDSEVAVRRGALSNVGRESLLKLDVTVSEPNDRNLPELKIGLSLKWSLRTDRAQDCRSQGAKLSALRRGRMPHFAAVTMEPRPYMLNLLGGGSGDVDCVYHLDLPALAGAIDDVYGATTDKTSRKTVETFQRLIDQRRVRDYDELVTYAISL